jgi:mono/diheme cytochrome c family protein
VNELAYRTHYSDVRDEALRVRRILKTQYIATYKDVYGNPPSDVTADAQPTQAPSGHVVPDSNLRSGMKLYLANCASCHGAEGQGGVGPSLQTNTLDVDDLAQVIENPPGPMPKLYPKPLSDDDAHEIARYIILNLRR